MPMTASAQTLYTGTPVPVAGAVDASGSSVESSARSATPRSVVSSVNTQGSKDLALTGIDVAELGLVGLGAVAAGAVLVRRGRRAH